MEQRFQNMRSKVHGTMERIETMEHFVQQTKENNTKADQLIKEQLETCVRDRKPNMEQSSRNNVNKMMLTSVIGNLDGLGSLAAAQVWLKEKFSALNGSKATNIYVKGTFQGMIGQGQGQPCMPHWAACFRHRSKKNKRNPTSIYTRHISSHNVGQTECEKFGQ